MNAQALTLRRPGRTAGEGEEHLLVHWDGLSDLAETAIAGSHTKGYRFYGMPRSYGIYITTKQGAEYLFTQCDKLGQEVEALACSISMPKIGDIRRRNIWQGEGDNLDMDRVRAGRLEVAWRSPKRRVAQVPPRIRIIIDAIVVWSQSADSLKWRGIAGCAILSALRAKGYQVALTVGAHSKIHGPVWDEARYCVTFMDLLPFGTPINAAGFAAGAIHPAAFRCLWLGALEKAGGRGENNGTTSETVQGAPEEAFRFANIGAREKILYVPKTCLSEEAARAYVQEACAEVLALSPTS